MFSKFFINRPIFATVLALLIVVAGLVTLNILPVAQFPEITPPTVQVSAVYPGANAETVAQTVGIPIEQQVNGVDGMLYMSSNSSSSGAYSLTITFAVGTDIDMATVQVQNRVSVAQSSLPEPVVVQGVTVQKQSSNIVMFLTMTSQDSVYNSLYLTNYAKLNLVDQLTRVPGVGAVNVMGAGDYSVRGRSKNMLLTSSGQNIYPEEIESKLNNMPYVSESLIVLQKEKLVALIYPDFDDAFANGLQQTDVERMMEANRNELNQQLPAYCQISKVKIHFEEFEKTAKKSIKRFMYQEAKG